LCANFREDAIQLLEDCINAVDEQYTNGLTHRTIRNWFTDYVEDVFSVAVKPYTKSSFKEVNGMYYVADVFDVDGNGWVNEEQLELLLHEFHNGVK